MSERLTKVKGRKAPFLEAMVEASIAAYFDYGEHDYPPKHDESHGVTIEPVTLMHIEEFETLIDSAEGPDFDLFAALQLRNFRDPQLMSELGQYLHSRPGFGTHHSTRREALEKEFHRCLAKYTFDVTDATAH